PEHVPRRREDHELEHRIRGGEVVIVGDEHARRDEGKRERESDGGEARVRHRPKSPDGLKARVASSSPKETAGAHDGPAKVAVKDSASPSTNASASVPRIEPMPPSTHTAKTRPMYSRPIAGCTGWITMRKEPATAAVAIESAKASSLTRTGFTPIRRSASWSCATASTARPKKVRVRKS